MKASKTAKASGNGVARCRVCHREMKNPAHIAAGVGPICAMKAGRGGARSVAKAVYSAAKLARVARNVRLCATAVEQAQEYRAAAYRIGTPEQQKRGEWMVWLTVRWLNRWRAIQADVAR